MYAVIRSGGKQYRVAPDDRISVERMTVQPGETITLGEVLMVGGNGAAPVVGAPMVAGAAVRAEVVEHTRAEKVIIFKKRRRQKSRRLKGHRQPLTVLRITGIDAEGFAPQTEAAPEPVAAPATNAGEPAVEAERPSSEAETVAPEAPEAAAEAAAEAVKTDEDMRPAASAATPDEESGMTADEEAGAETPAAGDEKPKE